MSRQAMFDAVRPLAPGRTFTPAQVRAGDAFADALGFPRVGDAPLDPTTADFADAAERLGCSVAQIRAVWDVEATGSGWFTGVRAEILALDGPGGFLDGSNLPKILFEAHHFDRLTGGRFRKSYPNLSSARWNKALYVGGQGEYERLHRAMQLDCDAALKSTSWGGPQIMGFNHALAGYATVDALVEAMKTGGRAHLMAFVAFVQNSGLTDALKAITTFHASAVAFARGYNGPGYSANDYHIKIARAFAKWSRA
ncbi:N-acetylmuramidase family protein [Brevundimonas sp.]